MRYSAGGIVRCNNCRTALYVTVVEIQTGSHVRPEQLQPAVPEVPEPKKGERIPDCWKCGSKIEVWKVEERTVDEKVTIKAR
ncbi:hypothetical protein [Cohnella sp. AR92]|uniref:hypothetical protein n=1 Tax=Cohnella sp. AR92 TaxID=648716 RepID=UPI000F8E9B0F|nr:hypothetical protein [Cohnella sp. AR92]RUS42277.1 hypothetical protein ELR57_27070 [Cohnella sp. AR92]